MPKPTLTHTQKQYIKWWKYSRACKDPEKRAWLFKQILILNAKLGKERES